MDFSFISELLSAGTPFLILGLWWMERTERIAVQAKLDRLTGVIEALSDNQSD